MKTYWIKATPRIESLASKPVIDGWYQLDGQEFYAFLNTPQAEGRYFITLLGSDKSDDILVLESDKEDYLKWRKEKRHRQYLSDFSKGVVTLPFSAFLSEGASFEESLSDPQANVERTALENITSAALYEALDKLSPEERLLVDLMFFSEITQKEVARSLGITQQGVSKKLMRILCKLKEIIIF